MPRRLGSVGRQIPHLHSPRNKRFLPGPTQPARLQQHYDATLSHDLLALLFQHHPRATPSKQQQPRAWGDSSPYHRNRPMRAPRGGLKVQPAPQMVTFRNVPRLQRIVVHTMVKEAIGNEGALLAARMAVERITGSKPVLVRARKGVAPWGLRVGAPIATKVGLQGPQMYHFLSTLVEVVMPRIKDFDGISGAAGDGNGNMSFGFPPQAMAAFPQIEVNYDSYPHLPGLHVNIVTTATTDRGAKLLLSSLGLPFK